MTVESWQLGLARLGMELPRFLVEDFGGLFTRAPPRAARDAPDPDAPSDVRDGYRALLREMGESPAVSRVRALPASDDRVVACLAHVLGFLSDPRAPSRAPSDLETGVHKGAPTNPTLLEALMSERLYVLTALDALPVDVLEMCARAGGETGSTRAIVDVLAALGDSRALDVARFSLELLPAIREVPSRKSADRTIPDGYGGLSRRGSIDALVPTELAWDDSEFERKLGEHELLHYTHEIGREPLPRNHHLLVDASASMRGDRATFARATAVSLAKKLSDQGQDVTLRFFDAHLYEKRAVKKGSVPAAYVSSFHGERGRCPAIAFSELVAELDGDNRDGAETVIHIFSHGAFHVPKRLLDALRARAKLFAIFFATNPSAIDSRVLDAVDRHWIVDPQRLTDGRERKKHAEDLLFGKGEGRATEASR